ncbi:hypothetical protein Glove_219g190 [Diversispora epigaea]|uniref:Uncharacterized protein n=1 Tax=Diversispora epigaea TaxID=1348612 RepID=A0A397IPY2_9GLOM|nr:hypothetical protein Glove_219g190 [Diversispora epigaea]
MEINENTSIEEWLLTANIVFKIWRKEAKKEINEKITEKIKKNIKKRQANLKDNPKTMIDSILGRWKKQIITDRILIQNKNDKTKIIRNPTKIKNEIKKHMEKWMANSNNDEEEEISEE